MSQPSVSATGPLRIVVGARLSGARVDLALKVLLPSYSRREIQQLCTEGRVRLAGRRVKKSDLLVDGATLEVELGGHRVTPDATIPLAVKWESDHWVIVAKPAQLPTAPRHGGESGTLVNALIAAYPEMATLGHRPLEPGLLHRLDNGTSGLLVAARTQQAFDSGTDALRQSLWEKSYLALLDHSELPKTGLLRGRLEAWPERPRRVRASSGVTLHSFEPGSTQNAPLRRFETAYLTLASHGSRRLVRVFVGPAFRHQIRAHFAAIDAPLVNDELYGAPREPSLAEGRHALHAARVAWTGTAFLPGFDVELPLEADLMSLALALGPISDA